ncbi:TonB system transport protein ExbD [Hahella ganghwensis]|uniref:TonB system transport protein ExbD n=1 Tax=Hahella ganghwensis TaxID=286420 RepID=UPI00037FDAB9|nr:TonB system transport protein ExbD [Hahella ganghwensis]
MAMLLPQKQDDYPENHDINVTPFIDVMLVLLIIFMVVAPLSTVSVNVDLPSSTAEPQVQENDPVILTLNTDGTLLLGEDRRVSRPELSEILNTATQNDKQQVIFIQADKRVDYDSLMSLLNDLRGAGYLKIALMGLEHSTAAR